MRVAHDRDDRGGLAFGQTPSRSLIPMIAAGSRASRRAIALLCAAAIAGCVDRPLAPPDDSGSKPELRGIALALRVDLLSGTITSVSASSAQAGAAGQDGPSLALLGSNELGVATSNFSRSATGAFTPKKQRVRFDVALTNKLAGAAFVTPTFPQPPLGVTSLLLFPFQISQVVGGGTVAPSVDWDGDGSAGSGAPYSFFNDETCGKAGTSDCYRWEGFPSPLNPGATSAPRTVGFDVDPSVQSFVVYMVLAADLQNASSPPPPGGGSGSIAFVSDRDGNSEIYLMNADGSGQTRLTTVSVPDVDPSRSADGSKIAFASDRDGDREIYVMNADGSGPTRLTNALGTDVEPAWSPDGSKIAFRSVRDGDYEIYVMNADGSGATRLTTSSLADGSPAWSPDGTKIAFVSNRDGNTEIYVMNADGSNPVNVTNQTYVDGSPAWSPAGTKIAFTSDRDGNNEIYVMNADGSGLTRLTFVTSNDQHPTWSPDGSKIAFDSDRDGTLQVYVMRADGSGQTRLTSTSASNQEPSWWP